MAESTRIADLPENITMKPVYSQDSANAGGGYAPQQQQNMNMSPPTVSMS